MAAGTTHLTIKDSANVTRTVIVQSDTAAVTGNLSPLQTLIGQDGAAIATVSNPVPANVTAVPANMTVVVSSGTVNANITGGNVTVSNPSVKPTAAAVPGNATAIGWSDAGGNLQIPSASNPLPVNIVLGNATLSGNATVTGPAAGNATVSGNPVQVGYRALNVEATPAQGNNTVIQPVTDIYGKTITSPFANRENWLSGAASTTGSGAANITGMGAQGAGVKIYITSLQVFRTDSGNTTAFVTLNDSASTTVVLPVGGGSNPTFATPLVIAANTTATFTPSTGLTTVYCNAQGWKGA